MAETSDVRRLALDAIDKAAQIDDLTKTSGEVAHPPSFAALYQFVHGTYLGDPDAFAKLVNEHPRTSENLEHLLREVAYVAMPKLAAAAGQQINRREHSGYILTISTSTVEPEQVYLSVETDLDTGAAPLHVFVKSATDGWHQQPIPPMMNGRAQLVLPSTSSLVEAFGKPDTVIFLR